MFVASLSKKLDALTELAYIWGTYGCKTNIQHFRIVRLCRYVIIEEQ